MWAINYNHMYGSWDIEHNRHNILSSWTIFCPFTPLKTQKIKILKKWKKCLKISFYTSVSKIMIICYTVPEIWHVTRCNFYFSFWAIFCLYPPNSLKNQNFKINLHMCNNNYDQMMYDSWDMVHDGQMDGRMEKVT